MAVILVTGARGRLGSALASFLASKGEEVVSVSRSDLDLARYDNVMRAVTEIKPRLIFHTAALTNVDECERYPERAHRDNVEASTNLAKAVAEVRARLVYFSTDYVFDGEKASAYTETDSPNPISVYGRTKFQAEEAVCEFVADNVIIRVAWLFGANGDFVSFVRRTIKDGTPLRLATDHRGSPGYIPDLLPGIWDIARSDSCCVFHLTNKGACNRFEMGTEIIRLLGASIEPIASTGHEIGFIARRPAQSTLSCIKFEKTFGKNLRTWQEALSDYLKNPG
ncbi:dTDP-4-dehydrorhamnose reductase [candidate division WOR-3 bacterium]|nr:dTDP-4-dehydrorhamnose reductase [candidate division WOR-3 bacterium]